MTLLLKTDFVWFALFLFATFVFSFILKYLTMLLIKLFITEDDPIYREYLIKDLGKQRFIKVVGWAENGDDLLMQIKKAKPNVILLDVIMPNTDIIITIRKVKELDIGLTQKQE